MILVEAATNTGKVESNMFQGLLRQSKCSAAVLVLGFVLAACATPILPTTNLPTATSISESVSTSTTAIMPTPMPSDTPVITATPVPTLSGERQDRLVEELLETNGGCELPCWWGDVIVPGKTTLKEAERILYSRGISYLVQAGVVDVIFQVPHTIAMQSWDYNARITLISQDRGLVHSIKVVGDTYSREPNPRFARVWREYYAWDRVLTKLGMPSQVLFSTSPETYAAPAGYDLTFVYESAGMLISYAGSAQETVTGKIRACPRFDQITDVMLKLVPSNEGNSLIGPKSLRFTLEETTGMSLQTFYDTFRASGGGTCLEQEIKP